MPSQRVIPPYFAQWESPRLVPAFLAGQDAAADPRWARSGAATRAEYADWAGHLCGMACLRMALAARGKRLSMHALRRAVQRHGGYVETPTGIRGLIYAGAVAWLRTQGIAAHIMLGVTPRRLAETLRRGLFIASVHPAIRRPGRRPPGRGGHLVLVFGTDAQGRLRLHNPSGDRPATQRDARLPAARFFPYFAGRGILIPC